MSGEERSSAEVDRLAKAARDVNLVDAVHALQGEFVHFVAREEAAYKAAAGDAASDAGLAAWINAREVEMNRCWRADIEAILTGSRR